tara:strand:- start:1644 stop:2630 length:987 start_codon:yes stop_codon:yes gene_type:complete
MLLKRYIPIAIVAFFGALTLSAWFIDNEAIETFANDDATQFFDIIAAFAVFLGALNLLKLQFIKVLKQQSGWIYSAIAIASFFFAFIIGFFVRGAYFVGEDIYFGEKSAIDSLISMDINDDEVWSGGYIVNENLYFSRDAAENAVRELELFSPVAWGAHVQTDGSLFQWMFQYIFSPLSATMFALLAFFVASASFRAFRARNFEASLLLVAGIIIMLGRVPVGSLISSWTIMYIFAFSIGIGINSYAKNRNIVFAWILVSCGLITGYGMITDWPIDQPSIFFLPALQEWIYLVPNLAGSRAILIGIGLGIVATSLRYIFGLEKSYLGE